MGEEDPYEIVETVSSTELKYISRPDITRLTRERERGENILRRGSPRLQITPSHEKISSLPTFAHILYKFSARVQPPKNTMDNAKLKPSIEIARGR